MKNPLSPPPTSSMLALSPQASHAGTSPPSSMERMVASPEYVLLISVATHPGEHVADSKDGSSRLRICE